MVWLVIVAGFIYLSAKLVIAVISNRALILFMLLKKYTPPTPKEMEACRREIVYKWINSD